MEITIGKNRRFIIAPFCVRYVQLAAVSVRYVQLAAVPDSDLDR